jgi:hypothetical protein
MSGGNLWSLVSDGLALSALAQAKLDVQVQGLGFRVHLRVSEFRVSAPEYTRCIPDVYLNG